MARFRGWRGAFKKIPPGASSFCVPFGCSLPEFFLRLGARVPGSRGTPMGAAASSASDGWRRVFPLFNRCSPCFIRGSPWHNLAVSLLYPCCILAVIHRARWRAALAPAVEGPGSWAIGGDAGRRGRRVVGHDAARVRGGCRRWRGH